MAKKVMTFGGNNPNRPLTTLSALTSLRLYDRHAADRERMHTKDYVIATTDHISLPHPVAPLRGRPSRSASFSPAAAARSLRTYFDWHPILGGFALTVVTAVAVTALFTFFQAVIPAAGGWAIFTPLNGAMIAILLISRRKLWPFLLLGYVLALSPGTLLAGAKHHPGAIEIFGNLAELLIVAFALPPYRNFRQWLQEPRLLRAFAGYALVLGPAVMALTVARLTAGSAGAVADLHAGFWERVRIVGFAESLGVALGTSLMLVLCNRQTYQLFRWRTLPGTVGLLSLLGLATWFAFTQSLDQTAYPVIFLPYAVLVIIAFQLGIRGAVLGTATVSAIITVLTVSGHASSAFASAQSGGPATLPQSYLALALLAALPLGVTLLRRNELEQRITDFQAELDKLKSLDRLTGVANRKRFDLVLAREWQRATRDPKPIALLMIDTDYFDLYNDYYGPQAGDECLRLIAAKMGRPSAAPVRPAVAVRWKPLLGAAAGSVRRCGEADRRRVPRRDCRARVAA